jgi:hypothetical protein
MPSEATPSIRGIELLSEENTDESDQQAQEGGAILE